MPKLTKAYGGFVDAFMEEVSAAVDTQWTVLTKLWGTMGGVIGEEADAMISKCWEPPTLSFEKPDIAFDMSLMHIPFRDNRDKTVMIITKEFTDAVLCYVTEQWFSECGHGRCAH
eukprot:Opistho-2@61312